jgi:hypothetical protein
MFAIIITALMRFFFRVSLLIISAPQDNRTLLMVSNVIVFASVGWYMSKMKICPDIKSHFVLAVIETSMCILIVEFLMGIWSSIESALYFLIKKAFVDLAPARILIINDVIVMMMAACILLSVIIDGKLFDEMIAFYRQFGMCGAIGCAPKPQSRPTSTKSARNSKLNTTLDPNCPIHGHNSSHH